MKFTFLDNSSRLPFFLSRIQFCTRCILRISTSRWVSSYHRLVDICKDSHECICFQTCNHDIRNDVDKHTTIFFILPTSDKGFSALVARLAFRLFKLFTSVCFFSFGTEEYACSRWEFLACLYFHPTFSSRSPVACVCNSAAIIKSYSSKSEKSFPVIYFGLMRSFSEAGCFDFLDPLQYENEILRFCANFNLDNHDPALKFRLVMEFLQMSLRGEITRNLSCHLSTSPNSHGMVSHRF